MDISNYENWIAYFKSIQKLAADSGIELDVELGQYNAFADSQRDDVKFAVHTSPDGEPIIMSKKQFGDWVCGYTGDYLRVYPYLAMDDALKESCVTTAKDDDGNDVILPILTIPQIEK